MENNYIIMKERIIKKKKVKSRKKPLQKTPGKLQAFRTK